MKTQKIRCAIAGLGRIGSTLEQDPLREKPASHAGAVVSGGSTRLIAGADPSGEARSDFRRDWGIGAVYEDAAEMIDREKPDILHIAAPSEDHPDLLRLALEREVPVIICEKPLADSLDEVRGLEEAVFRSTSRVVMNHERRFSRDYRAVRDCIREERYGPLLSVSCRLYMGRTRPVSRILYHDGTHMLDILRFLTGRELTVRSCYGDPDREGGQLFVQAAAGETGIVLDISGGRDHLVFELDLSFASGRIRLGNGVFEEWRSEASPWYSGFRSLNKIRDGWEGETGYFSGMMSHAAELFRNPEQENESSFQDGLAVLYLIEKILDACRN